LRRTLDVAVLLWHNCVVDRDITTANTLQSGDMPGIEDLALRCWQEEHARFEPARLGLPRNALLQHGAAEHQPVGVANSAGEPPATLEALAARDTVRPPLRSWRAGNDGIGIIASDDRCAGRRASG
jgi:hypothetical protein